MILHNYKNNICCLIFMMYPIIYSIISQVIAGKYELMGPISPSPLSDMLRDLPSVDVLLSVGELYSLKQMPTWWRLTHCGRILLESNADSVASNAKSSFGKYCSYLHIWHTFSVVHFFFHLTADAPVWISGIWLVIFIVTQIHAMISPNNEYLIAGRIVVIPAVPW